MFSMGSYPKVEIQDRREMRRSALCSENQCDQLRAAECPAGEAEHTAAPAVRAPA
jgi:hypothetical protein